MNNMLVPDLRWRINLKDHPKYGDINSVLVTGLEVDQDKNYTISLETGQNIVINEKDMSLVDAINLDAIVKKKTFLIEDMDTLQMTLDRYFERMMSISFEKFKQNIKDNKEVALQHGVELHEDSVVIHDSGGTQQGSAANENSRADTDTQSD